MKSQLPISPNVVNRLPKYLRYLRNINDNGINRISSAQIAQALGTTPSQVRQDFSAFGSFGSQGYGYNVGYLIGEIGKIIGLHYTHEIAIVGVGSIGRALLEHMEFDKFNYHVKAAFDISDDIVGTEINGIRVQHISVLPEFLRRNDIDICMLTVPKGAAKEMASILCMYSVPAIWNFTNEDLGLVGSDVIVQDVNFWDSLFALTYYLESSYVDHRQKAVNSY